MTLFINRVDDTLMRDYPATEKFSEGLDSIRVRTGFHRRPGSGKEVMLKKEVWVTNQQGTVIREEVDTWKYNTVHQPPTEHHREIRARLWLPGHTQRTGLQVVERQHTVFWGETIYAAQAGQLSYRKIRQGLVIYRRAAEDRELDADQETKLSAKGYNLTGATGDPGGDLGGLPDDTPPAPGDIEDRILDSVMTWDQAVDRAAIVEDETAPARTEWKTIEIVDHRVDDTWGMLITFTTTKDQLHPGAIKYDGPNYHKKPGIKFELQVELDPPSITGLRPGDGTVTASIKGGGAELPVSYPMGTTVPIRPDKYRLYRKVVTRPARTPHGDPLGLWDTPHAGGTVIGVGLDETAVTDTDGTPSTSLPTAGPAIEPAAEAPTPPDDDQWRLVGEVANAATAKWDEGHAAVVDTKMQSGASYSYRATCVVGDQESGPSQERSLTYSGAGSDHKVGVIVTTDADGNIDIDVVGPDDVEIYDALGDFGVEIDDYGETLVYDPLVYDLTGLSDGYAFGAIDSLADPAFTLAEEYGGTTFTTTAGTDWLGDLTGFASLHVGQLVRVKVQYTEDGEADALSVEATLDLEAAVIAAATELGTDIGNAHMARDRGLRRVSIVPSVPILGLRRGQYIKTPPVGWNAMGNDLIISSEIEQVLVRVDGWRLKFVANDDGSLETAGGDIIGVQVTI